MIILKKAACLTAIAAILFTATALYAEDEKFSTPEEEVQQAVEPAPDEGLKTQSEDDLEPPPELEEDGEEAAETESLPMEVTGAASEEGNTLMQNVLKGQLPDIQERKFKSAALWAGISMGVTGGILAGVDGNYTGEDILRTVLSGLVSGVIGWFFPEWFPDTGAEEVHGEQPPIEPVK